MIHFGAEGNVRQGINFYSWAERHHSIGFKIRIGRRAVAIRWSVRRRRLHVWYACAPKVMPEWAR